MTTTSNSTLVEEEKGGAEIPLSQVYCAVMVIILSLGSGMTLHRTQFANETFTKYAIPCEMVSLSVEVLLCGYLISTGEANPNSTAQALALISMFVVFVGQLTRTYLMRNRISNFVKLHLMLNIVMIPLCFVLVLDSLDGPLPDETHMLVLVVGLSSRLFINMLIIVVFYQKEKDSMDFDSEKPTMMHTNLSKILESSQSQSSGEIVLPFDSPKSDTASFNGGSMEVLDLNTEKNSTTSAKSRSIRQVA
jgi:hypothetical protein